MINTGKIYKIVGLILIGASFVGCNVTTENNDLGYNSSLAEGNIKETEEEGTQIDSIKETPAVSEIASSDSSLTEERKEAPKGREPLLKEPTNTPSEIVPNDEKEISQVLGGGTKTPSIEDNNSIPEAAPLKEMSDFDSLGEYYAETYVMFEGKKNDKDLALVENRKALIKTLPDTIISKLIEDNYIIYYISSDIDFTSFIRGNDNSSRGYEEGVSGVCVYSTRTIFLTCNVEKGEKPQNTFHEIGHAIDCYFYEHRGQLLSGRKSFLDVYNSDDYTIFFDRATTYFCQSPLEFFAQNFAYYFCPMEINPMDWDGHNAKKWFKAIDWH